MLKSFFKDSAIYTLPGLLSRGLSFFLFPLYTRVLSPTDYGAFDILVVFGNLITLSVALEISQGVSRYFVTEKDLEKKNRYASTSFWFSLGSYLLFLLVALFFASSISQLLLNEPEWESLFRLYAIHIFLYGLFCLIQNQFRYEFRSKIYAWVSIIVTLVTSSISVWLAYFLEWGVYGIIYGLISGSAVGCIYGLWHLRRTYSFRFDLKLLKEMLAFSAPLVPSSIAVFVSLYIDRLMINHFLDLEEVGLYGIGYRLASIVGLLMVGFKGALTPLVFANHQKESTPLDLEKVFRYFTAAALLMFLFLSLFAREILSYLTTSEYVAGAQVVIYLVPALFFSNMYIFAPGISIRKKTQYFIYINVSGAILNSALNYLLIPQFGITGAAIATLLGYCSVFLFHMVISQKLYPVPHKYRYLIGSFVTFFSISYFSSSLPLFYKIGIFFLSILLLLVFHLITVGEINKGVAIIRNRISSQVL